MFCIYSRWRCRPLLFWRIRFFVISVGILFVHRYCSFIPYDCLCLIIITKKCIVWNDSLVIKMILLWLNVSAAYKGWHVQKCQSDSRFSYCSKAKKHFQIVLMFFHSEYNLYSVSFSLKIVCGFDCCFFVVTQIAYRHNTNILFGASLICLILKIGYSITFLKENLFYQYKTPLNIHLLKVKCAVTNLKANQVWYYFLGLVNAATSSTTTTTTIWPLFSFPFN